MGQSLVHSCHDSMAESDIGSTRQMCGIPVGQHNKSQISAYHDMTFVVAMISNPNKKNYASFLDRDAGEIIRMRFAGLEHNKY